MPQRVLYAAASALVILAAAAIVGEDTDHSQDYLSAYGIRTRMHQSELLYSMEVLDSSAIDYDVIAPPIYYVKNDAGRITLHEYELSTELLSLMKAQAWAEEEGDIEGALSLSYAMRTLDPTYHVSLNFTGHWWLKQGQYDSALYYLRAAIDSNFIDYYAHWWLSQVYDELGEADSALRYATNAHLLNVNHPLLKERFIDARKKVGRTFNDWTFRPQYRITEDSSGIHVETTVEWLFYSMMIALWKHEPGVAEEFGGGDLLGNVADFNRKAVQNAILVTMEMDTTKLEQLSPIFEAGYTDEFMWYEIFAPQEPVFMFMLPRDYFERAYEYVDRFH